jgi:hypothetical protein
MTYPRGRHPPKSPFEDMIAKSRQTVIARSESASDAAISLAQSAEVQEIAAVA